MRNDLHRRRARRVLPTMVLLAVTAGALAACGDASAPASSTSSASPAPSAPASDSPASDSPGGAETHMVDAGAGRSLAFHVTPGGLPALVLDSGGGMDSSYWDDLVPQLAAATGSTIITYDRAGLGDSDGVPGAWDVQGAVNDLETGLRALGVTQDVVLVAHSQGGEVATYFTCANPQLVSGAVLVDANLPQLYTDETIERLVAVGTPQVEAAKEDPSTKQNRQLIATAENYAPMHRAYHQVTWPDDVPAAVIVSEKTPFDGLPEDAQRWRDAAAAFVAAGPDRTLVTAEGTSHDVPLDRPDIVLDEIETMVAARD